MKIWLDDQLDDTERPERLTPAGFRGARNFAEFKALIEKSVRDNELIEVIDFDNDLGDGEKEGHEILTWLSENYPKLVVGETEIKIHSANTVENEAMRKQLESYSRNKELLLSAKDREYPWREIEKPK